VASITRIIKGQLVLIWLLAMAIGMGACSKQSNVQKHRIYSSNHYTIRPGDTLYTIAWRYKIDYKRLALWNGISPPYVIYPGQKLRVTAPAVIPLAKRPQPSTASNSTPTKTVRRATVAKPKNVPAASTAQQQPRWRWPTNGKVIRRFAHTGTGNKGIDIAGISGQSVRAASQGKVVYSGSGLLGYGQLIIIKHNETYLSAYAHNRKLLVNEGDRVSVGQMIAEMGETGTDRAKLHFEIRRYGKPVDPLKYLPHK